uniref:Uncharacterized protein n=1 Tax=Electrophorus electricus TaxID=8005 RepID=A0A4W4E6T4_ELEEL
IVTGAFSKVYLGCATSNKISKNYKLANYLRCKNHNMVSINIISINDAPPNYSKIFLHPNVVSPGHSILILTFLLGTSFRSLFEISV